MRGRTRAAAFMREIADMQLSLGHPAQGMALRTVHLWWEIVRRRDSAQDDE